MSKTEIPACEAESLSGYRHDNRDSSCVTAVDETRKDIPGRGKRKFKGPEVGTCLG